MEWHIPCKYFWAVFRFYPSWNWARLPESYKASAYLSTDTGALETFFNDSPGDADCQPQDSSLAEDIRTPAQDEIPKQQVAITKCMYFCM